MLAVHLHITKNLPVNLLLASKARNPKTMSIVVLIEYVLALILKRKPAN